MFDCSDLAQHGLKASGVYKLLGDDTSHPLSEKDVYCDMDTDRGGYNHIKLLFFFKNQVDYSVLRKNVCVRFDSRLVSTSRRRFDIRVRILKQMDNDCTSL